MIFPGVPCTIAVMESAITLVNNTALSAYEPSAPPGKPANFVPPGEIWFVIAGSGTNGDSVTRAVTCSLMDAASQNSFGFCSGNAGAGGYIAFPTTSASGIVWQGGIPIPMFPGERVRYYFAAGGASAGGTGRTNLRVLQYKIADLRKHGITVNRKGMITT